MLQHLQKIFGFISLAIIGLAAAYFTPSSPKTAQTADCLVSTARPCYDRVTPGKTFGLAVKAGENSFNACVSSSSGSKQGTGKINTGQCEDEPYSYCYEGKSNVVVRKFEGSCGTQPPIPPEPALSCQPLNIYRKLSQRDQLFNPTENVKGLTMQVHPAGFVLADFDGDKDLDLASTVWDLDEELTFEQMYGQGGPVISAATYVRVYFNDGSGVYADSGQYLWADDTKLVAGDLNGDGFADLISGKLEGRTSQVYINDKKGYFSPNGQIFGSLERLQELADVDKDGDLDLVVLKSFWDSTYPKTAIYLNDGYGRFSEKKDTGIIAGSAYNMTVFDIDKDGDPDLLEAHAGPTQYTSAIWAYGYAPLFYIYRNDGTGKFTVSQRFDFPQSVMSNPIYFGDIDKDGDLDFVADDYNTGIEYMLGPEGYDARFALTNIDMVFRNNGSGSFILDDQRIHMGTSAFQRPGRLPDIDDDGDPDIETVAMFLLNNGKGTFTPYCLDNDAAAVSAFGDINFDKKTDWVFVAEPTGEGIYIKTYLQK